MKRRRKVLSKFYAIVRANKIKPKLILKSKTSRSVQVLSETDKLVVVHKYVRDKNGLKILEITTVAFVTDVNGEEFTVIYYDNFHDGVLHMHRRQSVQSSSESIIPVLRKELNQKKQLHWAINEVRNRWYYFKHSFIKRSNLLE